MNKNREQLFDENVELRSRLLEIEEALAAIRNGEVDAIMVSGKQGEQVYSVSSAETPYRTFIEQMSEGAVTLTKEGVILYCNPRFAEFVQSRFESVIGTSLNRYIARGDDSRLDVFLSQITQDKHNAIIVSLTNSIYLRLSIHLMPPYLNGDHFMLIATDVTDLKRREIELNEIIAELLKRIKALQALRIDNIRDALDIEGRKNQLEIANTKLYREIIKLKSLVMKLKEERKKTTKAQK